MRLWHYKLIPYLPKSQLLAQKRECDLILKDYWNGKQTNHILINYVHTYSNVDFAVYYSRLYNEFERRGLNFRDKYNIVLYDYMDKIDIFLCFCNHHNNEYLAICYYNLKEKYLRGQKDFTKEIWDKLDEFYKKEIKE